VRRWISTRGLGLAAALAAALLGCARPTPDATAPRPRAPQVTPLLWRADAPEPRQGSFFLLGSVHLGTRAMSDLGGAVDEAYRLSDELVVEVDVSDVAPQQAAALTERYATLPASRTLRDVLSDETHRLLVDYLAKRRLSPSQVERLKPWFLSFMILQLELNTAGYEPEFGVDRVLLERAAAEKPVVGLETMASQLATMDRLAPALQELMLKDALVRMDRLVPDAIDLIEAWQRGDEARLREILFSPLLEFPELEAFYELVFYQRNETMAASLASMAADGKTRFVVVGAGHMVGERGIPAHLATRGYRVRRIHAPADAADGS
jgi:uncharacterized protein YbaP (TraB family)